MAVVASPGPTMLRDVDWKHVVFVAAGVPALVLFSMGAISATVGTPAWVVWTISVLFGFAQSFIYAEIAGLHPSKTGGTAVHGATAWIRYSRILAPLSLWANWLAWTPVLAIGAGPGRRISALDLLRLRTRPMHVLAVDPARSRLHLRRGCRCVSMPPSCLGAAIMLVPSSPSSIAASCARRRSRRMLTIASLLPLFIVCIIPLLQGECAGRELYAPFTPLATNNGQVVPGVWDRGGWVPVPGRAVHRRLVGLCLRDLRLLHERVQESGPRHAAGDHRLGPDLHRRLCRHPRGLPGRARERRRCWIPASMPAPGMGLALAEHAPCRSGDHARSSWSCCSSA